MTISPKRVPPIGPLNARIAIVGEAPGADEEREGLPFVGASGKLLNSLLASAGINRHECYITNVVKIRPASNDFDIFYTDGPRRGEPSPLLRSSTTELLGELRSVGPNVIIPLGAEALRAVVGKIGIDKWRGSVLSSGVGKCVPSVHPARVLREYTFLPILEHDLRRAREESSFPEVRPLPHKFELNPPFSRVVAFLQDLLANPRPIALDIETTANHTRCLAIADTAHHAVCIPFMSSRRPPSATPQALVLFLGPTTSAASNSHWSEEEEWEILRLLDRVLSCPAVGKYLQNFPFDSSILGREFGFRISGLLLDTLVAAHTMYCELRKSLDFLTSLYTKVPYYSDYDASVDEELWRYNCFDACVTYEISHVLLHDLSERHPSAGCPAYTSQHFQLNHIQPAMQVMTRVGTRGVLLDTKVRDELRTKYTAEMGPLLAEFHQLSGTTVNPNSPKQMKEWLYDKCKFPPQTNKQKKLTTDSDALEALQRKFIQHHRMFQCLLDWKERQKLVSTYLDIDTDERGHLLTNFNVVGTVTGRCNSGRTIWGVGTNLQNIPIRTDLGQPLRRMFRADDDHVLVKCDLSQAEFRLVVWFAGVRRLLERYARGEDFDVHRWVASLCYNVPEAKVSKAQRSLAKNGVYGGNYSMAATTAARTWKVPLTDARFMLESYRRIIPEIPAWWKTVEAQLVRDRTLVSPMGRVRVFLDRLDDSTFRDAYSHSCQCVVADIIHRAVVVLELILPPECRPVLQVHDELVFLCHKSVLAHVLPVIKTVMEYTLSIPPVPEPLVIPAELSYGPNWLDQTKWHPSDAVVAGPTASPRTDSPLAGEPRPAGV